VPVAQLLKSLDKKDIADLEFLIIPTTREYGGNSKGDDQPRSSASRN
jgi:hypothetical protein